ncbi:Transposase [Bacteroidales bacterium Barb7]|nr:Transposase [Bacteroidales bacterium Barb7]
MEKDISYEITVIPQALSSMDITDAVVSMDAMGTPTGIASQITEVYFAYLVRLKRHVQRPWKFFHANTCYWEK